MLYSIHKCDADHPGNRALLGWIASRTTSPSVRATLKHNVVALRWELENGKYALSFLMDCIVSLRTMHNAIPAFEPGLKKAYEEIEIDLVEIRAQQV